MREIDRAYLAGFIDADGSIGVNKLQTGSTIRVTASNTAIPVLEELKSLWGGSICISSDKRSNHKPHGNLVWTARAAKEILLAIQPYLKIKQEQCRVALSFMNTVNPPDKQFEPLSPAVRWARQKMRGMLLHLNSRGVPVT